MNNDHLSTWQIDHEELEDYIEVESGCDDSDSEGWETDSSYAGSLWEQYSDDDGDSSDSCVVYM